MRWEVSIIVLRAAFTARYNVCALLNPWDQGGKKEHSRGLLAERTDVHQQPQKHIGCNLDLARGIDDGVTRF